GAYGKNGGRGACRVKIDRAVVGIQPGRVRAGGVFECRVTDSDIAASANADAAGLLEQVGRVAGVIVDLQMNVCRDRDGARVHERSGAKKDVVAVSGRAGRGDGAIVGEVGSGVHVQICGIAGARVEQ